jgi:hypothetical protein
MPAVLRFAPSEAWNLDAIKYHSQRLRKRGKDAVQNGWIKASSRLVRFGNQANEERTHYTKFPIVDALSLSWPDFSLRNSRSQGTSFLIPSWVAAQHSSRQPYSGGKRVASTGGAIFIL